MTSTTAGAELQPTPRAWLTQAAARHALEATLVDLNEDVRPRALDGTPMRAEVQGVEHLDVLHEHDPGGRVGVRTYGLGPSRSAGDL